jgi:hypothetical protein
MADQNYEIDIEAGHDDEMQVDQRGRGEDSRITFGNATDAESQGPVLAVRCTSPLTQKSPNWDGFADLH